ncbi:hypothetical protein HLH33_17210 [Gluconacetobacter diazotrophicus]|uniref:Uncharacterized protein n=1 Tax=Gluconacetobacter diazotrophicus TaxID=33996 RepID=A0A7W4I841_GLUDI|nr:hypothetical protein [Gluconacetobacter diazotrophicus]MBB2158012.1 hypothetical protein [Gluconacetobacter diazotrophicus]
MTDKQTPGPGWVRHAVVGALSGAVGSVVTLFCLSGNLAPHLPRAVVVAQPSAETTAEIAEKAQAKLADRMANAIVEGIKHD